MNKLALILAFISLPAFAGEPWSTQDKVLFGVSTTLLVADWAQTRTIAKNPDRWYETNPLLGKHPSVSRVNNYFATTLVANYFITDYLSPKWRTRFQGGLIAVELVVVGNNKRIGIGMSF